MKHYFMPQEWLKGENKGGARLTEKVRECSWIRLHGTEQGGLVLVKVLQLKHGDEPVIVQINTPKPVVNAGGVALVLFRDQKP